jgi:ABC-type multidrug transport system ATPase subunit
MQKVLEVDSITKSYNYKAVLRGIYLKCQTGNILGILGRNGSGKSTLMEIIFGTIDTENKFIRMDGKIYKELYKNNRIAYLPQNDFLPRYITVEAVVRLCYNGLMAKKILDDKIIDKLKKTKTRNLSRGELRYLENIIILNLDTDFMMLDEPFSGLSPLIVTDVKKMIREASKTKGILVSDHDYRNVLDVANEIWLIRDGGIKKINGINELMEWGYIPSHSV